MKTKRVSVTAFINISFIVISFIRLLMSFADYYRISEDFSQTEPELEYFASEYSPFVERLLYAGEYRITIDSKPGNKEKYKINSVYDTDDTDSYNKAKANWEIIWNKYKFEFIYIIFFRFILFAWSCFLLLLVKLLNRAGNKRNMKRVCFSTGVLFMAVLIKSVIIGEELKPFAEINDYSEYGKSERLISDRGIKSIVENLSNKGRNTVVIVNNEVKKTKDNPDATEYLDIETEIYISGNDCYYKLPLKEQRPVYIYNEDFSIKRAALKEEEESLRQFVKDTAKIYGSANPLVEGEKRFLLGFLNAAALFDFIAMIFKITAAKDVTTTDKKMKKGFVVFSVGTCIIAVSMLITFKAIERFAEIPNDSASRLEFSSDVYNNFIELLTYEGEYCISVRTVNKGFGFIETDMDVGIRETADEDKYIERKQFWEQNVNRYRSRYMHVIFIRLILLVWAVISFLILLLINRASDKKFLKRIYKPAAVLFAAVIVSSSVYLFNSMPGSIDNQTDSDMSRALLSERGLKAIGRYLSGSYKSISYMNNKIEDGVYKRDFYFLKNNPDNYGISPEEYEFYKLPFDESETTYIYNAKQQIVRAADKEDIEEIKDFIHESASQYLQRTLFEEEIQYVLFMTCLIIVADIIIMMIPGAKAP